MGSILAKFKKSREEESLMISSKKPSLTFKDTTSIKIKNKLTLAKRRLNNFFKTGMKATSWIVWVAGVSVVVLITPVVFQYEKECQLFEMQAQFFQAQQAANVPQLN